MATPCNTSGSVTVLSVIDAWRRAVPLMGSYVGCSTQLVQCRKTHTNRLEIRKVLFVLNELMLVGQFGSKPS